MGCPANVGVPLDVADDERIVRAICAPVHIDSKGRLKHGAFDPRPVGQGMSVMRHAYMDADACKVRGQALTTQNKTYKGLAVLLAARIRATGAEVVDSRAIYLGHGDITQDDILGGVVIVPHEPPPAAVRERLLARAKNLTRAAVYYTDPQPDGPTWTGPPLAPLPDDAPVMADGGSCRLYIKVQSRPPERIPFTRVRACNGVDEKSDEPNGRWPWRPSSLGASRSSHGP